jgi:hypothetical protein
MRTEKIKILHFDELSDKAKEKAREWWRKQTDASDLENVTDMVKEVATWCGFDKHAELYWSLGYSQSDHASIVGTWHAEQVQAETLQKEIPAFPLGREFILLAEQLPELYFTTHERYHIAEYGGAVLSEDDYQQLKDLVYNFNHWAYWQIREEDQYQSEDEYVDDMLRGNEYEFTEDGEIWS